MQIGKISNNSFQGYLEINGYEYKQNRKKETVLKPIRKFLDTNLIQSIKETNKEVIIDYKDKKSDYNVISLPYEHTLDKVERDKDLAYYNLVLNAYTAAASNPDVAITIPRMAYII